MQFLLIASTAMSVIGQISSGRQQSKQYEAMAQANAYNAMINRQRADQTRSVYGQREERQRREAAFVIGKQKAASAQSGIGLGGTNADLENQSEIFAELDALNIRYEGELEAQGLLAQANLDDMQASQNRSNASSARKSGYLGAAGALLSGTGDYLKAGYKIPGVG